MTKKFWAKSPRNRKSIDGYASATPRSARSTSGDSVSVTAGTPSKKRRGIRVILGCRNNARLHKDHFEDLSKTENETPDSDEVHALPIEYPHTDLSMSHSSSYTASITKEDTASNANQEFTIESEVQKCIQGLKDYITSISSPDWISSGIILATMEKVNDLTSCTTVCLPTFSDSRTVHSDSSVIMNSKEATTNAGMSKNRSWPLSSNDAYFKTAAQAQAEELKRITAKLEDERQQHEALSLLIDNLKKDIATMKTTELELNQSNTQATVKTLLMKEKMELQLVNHQDELQKMEAKWHSESEQVIALRSEISRLSSEIVAATAAMRTMGEEARQTTEANESELKAKAEQLKTLEDKLSSECEKNTTLQADIEELKLQISDANSKNNVVQEMTTVSVINSEASQPLRVIIDTPSMELEGVEHDLVAFNATSVREMELEDDALIGTSDVRNAVVQEVTAPPPPPPPPTCAEEVIEEVANIEESTSAVSHTESTASGITSLRVHSKPYGWFQKLVHHPDDKSQSTTGSSIHSRNILEYMRRYVLCAVGTNHDITTMADESQVTSHDDMDDKHGYSTSFSRSFDSARGKIQQNASTGSDSTSTQSSESDAMEFPLPSLSVSSADELSYSSDNCESTDKNPTTNKGNRGPIGWLRPPKPPVQRKEVRDRDRSRRGMILVQ